VTGVPRDAAGRAALRPRRCGDPQSGLAARLDRGPLLTGDDAALLAAAGAARHSLALRWLAVPAGLAWAAWLCRYSVLRAQRRLQTQGPEIFARLRTS